MNEPRLKWYADAIALGRWTATVRVQGRRATPDMWLEVTWVIRVPPPIGPAPSRMRALRLVTGRFNTVLVEEVGMYPDHVDALAACEAMAERYARALLEGFTHHGPTT